MENDNLNQNQPSQSTPIPPTNQGGVIHSAVGDIHVPSSRIPADMDFKFNPQVPITMPSDEGYGVSTSEKGIQSPKPGFWKTAAAEAYEFNATAEILHAGYSKYEQPDPLVDIPPSDWTPTSNTDMYYDIKPQYMQYLMESRGPKDQQYRRDRILSEQEHDDTLENGSMFARIIGGIGGIVTDPISYIPIAGEVKYAKFAPTILKTVQRALPGMATVGIAQAGAKQLDKVNGNLHDFVIDSAINTVFGLGVFGALKGLSLGLDKMELWNLRGISKASIKGIDFKFNLGEKGEIKGVKAFDTTGNLSAAEVSYAQELADSSFNKSGFFKIPYVSDAAIKLASTPYIGTPMMQMINSPYMTVRGFIDRAADHGILTKGVAEGGTQPKSFEFFMKREYASLRSISAEMNALHLQRNGVKLDNRAARDVTQIGMGLYNKSLKLLGKDMDKTGYVSRDQFHDEVQRVLFTKEPSQNAATNEAASLMRTKIDDTYQAYLKAYNLPEDILDPRTAAGYLMRVYDTPYLNVNKDKWVNVVSTWLRDADTTIADRMEPIRSLETQLEDAKRFHSELIQRRNVSDKQVKTSSDKIDKLMRDVKVANHTLQNELRTNPEFNLHVDNLHALSADEAKEIEQLTKPLNDMKKKMDEQQKVISDLKSKKSKSKTSAQKGKTVETAKKHADAEIEHLKQIQVEEEKFHQLKLDVENEKNNLYERMRSGEVNPRLYYPQTYELKNVNDRLKFRDIYGSDFERQNHAKAYYDSIMHMTPEDTIADVMGKVMGNSSENHLKSRTLLLPDELLYNNNFMTKDLMAKLANYSTYLSRRTHLKNVFKDVTHDGGIEPLIEKLNLEYKSNREPWDTRKAEISERLKELEKEAKQENLSDSAKKRIEEDKQQLTDENKALEKDLKKEAKRFNDAKELMNKSYHRMMNIRQRSPGEAKAKSAIMSITAMTNLHFLPATQIADLGSIGLQHGVWPFVRDAVYPAVQSLGGILKTKDSEALRRSAPSVHLALQDQLSGYADKNWAMEAQPYLNLGRWVGGIEKLAHFSSNADLTTYIDNGLQRLSGATVQAEFMRILHAFKEGKMHPLDGEYLRKYGIDPAKWSDRMIKAYEDAGGYKTKLGGYQSKFWEWTDQEAANEFSDAVFKGIQNTIINRGMFDSPFWADNFLGMMFHTFTGWGYSSINRYLIPMLQRPDAEKMLGVVVSMGFGSMVSPLRRAIRGEDPVPDQMSDAQRFWEVINDSNATSAMANTLSWANLLSGDRILGDLKNDKYRNRMQMGALGPVAGTVNRMVNIFSALASGEMNQKDANEMAKMLPVMGSVWGYYLSKMMIDKLGLPPTRGAAHAENG